MTAGRIARQLWGTNQQFCPADITPPWFSMLIYHLQDEQQARLWPEVKDTVSAPQHDHHHHSKGMRQNMEYII
jgi:hypothetical protein